MSTEATQHPAVTLGQLPGVWRRDLYQAGEHSDTESLVFWIQAGQLYGDLRDEPERRIAFSGTLSQKADIFTWAMPLASFVEPEFPDAGRLHWDGSDLIETGVYQDYTEIWRRVGEVTADDYALRLENDSGETGFVLQTSGFRFAMVGKQGDVASHAALRGDCPRFGRFERSIGDPGVLAPLFEQTTKQAIPAGWHVLCSETNLKEGGVLLNG